jgi:hypothetical protein
MKQGSDSSFDRECSSLTRRFGLSLERLVICWQVWHDFFSRDLGVITSHAVRDVIGRLVHGCKITLNST